MAFRNDLEEKDEKEHKGEGHPQQQQAPIPYTEGRAAEKDEAKLIQRFRDNDENTHNVVISSSVGTAILKLKERYLPDATDQTISSAYESALREIQTHETPELKEAIQFLAERASESLDLTDRVTLCLAGKKEEIYQFQLKEVVMLVWKALHDHDRYLHHFTGSEVEKREQAKRELPIRLNSFFNCLKQLKSNPVCHHGTRNELMFLLNKGHEDIHLIEDDRMTILAVIKEELYQLFKLTYDSKNEADKLILQNELIAWIESGNASKIIQLLDPSKKILKKLSDLFTQNGVNPDYIKLEALFQESIASVSFACNPKTDPQLFHLSALLTLDETNLNANKKRALLKIKAWLKKSFRLDDENDKKNLKIYYLYFEFHELYSKNEFLLTVAGKLSDSLIAFAKKVETYFKLIAEDSTPLAEENIEEIVSTLRKNIESSKKDNLKSEIENFFINWFTAKKDNEAAHLNSLYFFIRSNQSRDKIVLTDEAIKTILSSRNAVTQEIMVSPYEINQVFLHAILIEPSEWSDLFSILFNKTLNFVKSNFNLEDKKEHILKKDSYPSDLLSQLDYLKDKQLGKNTKRPKGMLLLPSQVKTKEEWESAINLLTEEEHQTTYAAYSALLETVFLKYLPQISVQGEIFKTFYEIIKSIPSEARMAFIKRCHSKKYEVHTFFSCIENIISLYGLIPKNQRASFLEFLKTEINIDDLFQKSNIKNFFDTLSNLPEDERVIFIDAAKLNIKEKLKNYDHLILFLRSLPYEERSNAFQKYDIDFHAYATTLWHLQNLFSFCSPETVIHYVDSSPILFTNGFSNHQHFMSFIACIPEDKRLHFIHTKKININKVRNSVHEFIKIAEALPINDRKIFLKKNLNSVLNLVKNLTDVLNILNLIPENEWKDLALELKEKLTSLCDLEKAVTLFKEKILFFFNLILEASLFSVWIDSTNKLIYLLILAQVHPDKKYSFLVQIKDELKKLIKNGHDLNALLNAIPQKEDRLKLLKDIGLDLKSLDLSASWLIYISKNSLNIDPLQYANEEKLDKKSLIKHSDDFSFFGLIPIERRINELEEHKLDYGQLITSWEDLIKLRALFTDPVVFIDFVSKNNITVKQSLTLHNVSDLVTFLLPVPGLKQNELIEKTRLGISRTNPGTIANYLPPEKSREFKFLFLIIIRTCIDIAWNDLTVLLNILHPDDRMRYIKEIYQLSLIIKNSEHFFILYPVFPNKLEFLVECGLTHIKEEHYEALAKDLPQDYETLVNTIPKFKSNEDKLTFLKIIYPILKDAVKNVEQVLQILKAFPEPIRLRAFFIIPISALKATLTINSIELVVNSFPPKEWQTLLLHIHTQINSLLRTGDDLIRLLNLFPQQNRTTFMQLFDFVIKELKLTKEHKTIMKRLLPKEPSLSDSFARMFRKNPESTKKHDAVHPHPRNQMEQKSP